ncbi:MAG: DUF4147 domain-containing protein [Chloroflexi bacterium]|nr:MAG: DUF4147 domain-containing protein [Chloroflexota bacterium]
MPRILNTGELTSHGNIAGRRAMVEILEAGLQAVDPYFNTLKLMRRRGNILTIGGPDFEPHGDPQGGRPEVIDLDSVNRIFVFGAGKGIQRSAKAIEEILGDRLTGGHVIDKKGTPLILENIGVTFGAHPVPDEDCVRGCRRILEMTRDLREDDLVFTTVSNGVSSLLTLPAPGLTLADVGQVTHLMQIERGLHTSELGPVRNQLDQMKGGRLSRHIQPARAIHLVNHWLWAYDDLMYRNRWLHSLPTYSTFDMAVNLLKKWNCWDDVSPAVREHLLRADPAQDTVKAAEFQKNRFRIFCTLPDHLGAIPAARQKAREFGFKPILLYDNNVMSVEAAQMGKVVANMARHSEQDGQPFEPPCALIGRTELLVTVGAERGMGGRNQEYALAAALEIAGTEHVVMGSVDTDGTDGPGHQFVDGCDDIPVLTGGVVDGTSAARARELGIDLFEAIKTHNTSPAIYRLGDGVVASPSLSMIDLSVTLVLGRSNRT